MNKYQFHTVYTKLYCHEQGYYIENSSFEQSSNYLQCPDGKQCNVDSELKDNLCTGGSPYQDAYRKNES